MNSGSAITESGTGKLNVTFDADTAKGGGGISIAGNITTGGGNIVMGGQGTPLTTPAVGDSTYGTGIAITSTVNAGSGSITLNGQGYGGTAGSYYGVYINAGTVEVTGSGNLTIYGQGGGNASDSTGSDFGVYLYDGTVETTSTGNILLHGTGGDTGGTGANNFGVAVEYNSIGSIVESTESTGNASLGSITVQGVGGAGSTSTGSGNNNVGIDEGNGDQITSVDGAITLTGTGGTSDSGNDLGISLHFAGASAIKTTGIGNITLTGTSTDNDSMDLEASEISATGTGNITLTYGTGSTGQLWLDDGQTITTASGTITLNAGASDLQSASGTANVVGGNTTTGDITLIQNALNLSNLTVKTSGNITIEPYTSGTSMGVNNAGSTLNLTTAEEGYFTWGKTLFLGGNTVGTATAGNITVKSGTVLNTGNVTVIGTGNITVAAAVTKSSGAADTLTLEAGNHVSDNTSSAITTSGNSLNIIMDSDTAGGATGGFISIASNITSGGGNITMGGNEANPASIAAGTGYAVGSNSNNTQYGIYINGATVNAGSGLIIMNGQGGTYAGGGDDGIYVHGSAIQTSSTGNITLTGTGGTSTSGTNYGVYLDKSASASSVTGSSGAITITGIDGSGGTDYGFATDANSNAIGTGSGTTTGNITLQFNDYSLGTLAINTTGAVTFEPYTTSNTVGVNNSGSNLNIQTGSGQFINDVSGASAIIIGSSSDTNTLTAAATTWGFNAQLLNGSGNITIAGRRRWAAMRSWPIRRRAT